MKKAIIAVLILVTLVAGYVAASSSLRLSLSALEGTTATIGRGDLAVPIESNGVINPYRRVQIKSKASGEVEEVFKNPGDVVKRGELLIKLDPIDEQRNYDRATLDVRDAAARLEQARIALEKAQGADLAAAEASVKQFKANLKLSEFRAIRAEEEPGAYHAEELIQRQSTYEHQLAQLEAAQAALEQAKLAVRHAKQAVEQAHAVHEAKVTTMKDARRRLEETEIYSPIDGIIGQVFTQVGEMIQSGTAAFTSGTLLAYVLDMERLTVQVEVDEADIGRVLEFAPEWALPGRPSGQRMPDDLAEAAAQVKHLAEIKVEAFPDQPFEGILERIHPEPIERMNVVTYLADVVIHGGGERRRLLLPGMRADVKFTSEHRENVILCPNEAIRRGPDGDLGVFMKRNGGQADVREMLFIPCEFGLDDGRHSQVISGLEEGDEVYTRLPAWTEDGREGRTQRR